MSLIDTLEHRLLLVNFSQCYDDDFIYGQKEALKFCIRKHNENWIKKDFEKDLEGKLIEMKKQNGEYKDGIICVLKFNISQMEDLNEKY